MAVAYKETLCCTCNGTGEVEMEPGNEYYGSYYDDCYVCNGDGYIKLYPDAVYNPDRM